MTAALTATALVSGEPGPAELWLLREISSVCVLRAARIGGPPEPHSAGLGPAERELLDELFDAVELRGWWAAAAVAAPLGTTADVVVRLSGHAPPEAASWAELAALDVRHGPIALGLAEGRREWIRSTVSMLGGGPALWRGAPQLAPGDTRADVLFRAHVEAARALAGLLRRYAAGETPEPRAAEREAPDPGWLDRLGAGRPSADRLLLERGLEC